MSLMVVDDDGRKPRSVTRTTHRQIAFSHWLFIEALQNAEMEPSDLAAEIGCSLEAVARWMAGIAVPKPGYATQAARILGVEVDEFYE